MPHREQSTRLPTDCHTQSIVQQLARHQQQEVELREIVLNLSTQELVTIIPDGPYCYAVLAPLPSPAIGHKIQPCPFLIGSRPDTTCFLNPVKDYATDFGYNVDACKGCGINDGDTG